MWPHTKKSPRWPSTDPAATTTGTVPTGPFTVLPAAEHRGHAANDDHRPAPLDTALRATTALARRTLTRVFGLPRHMITAVVAWRRRQILKESLLAMDRHQLADIGLTPADIPAVVEGHFRRRQGGPA